MDRGVPVPLQPTQVLRLLDRIESLQASADGGDE